MTSTAELGLVAFGFEEFTKTGDLDAVIQPSSHLHGGSHSGYI